MKHYFLPGLLLVLVLVSVEVHASTLFGRVVQVNDGDVITVFNLNRPVRVKLLAVDAPEATQAFGDVARKHLSDLVYDKLVLVEYWSIAADSSLVGRVMLNNADVGAQMIRDGAAWFDASNQTHLSAADREVYQQSEQAARTERRGLWQAEDPIAPWEFVRATTLRKNPAASLNSILPATKSPADRPTPELNNLTLIASKVQSAAAANVPAELAWAVDTSVKQWSLFRPDGENFSADMPEGGRHLKYPYQFGEDTIEVNLYAVRDGNAIYTTMWMTGPTLDESDKVAIDSTVDGFLKGFTAGFESRSSTDFRCELQGERNISINGYAGREYDLPSCTVPGKIRVFTKALGKKRKVYCAAVFYWQDEPNVSRFLKSFTAGSASVTSRTARRRS